MSLPSMSLETLFSTSSYLVANGAVVDPIGAGLHVEPSKGHGGKCRGLAEELGHYGDRLEQSTDVDAAALLQEGRGCVEHGADEV